MEYLLQSRFSWATMLTTALGLLAVYVLLRLVIGLLDRGTWLGKWQPTIQQSIRHILLLYEGIVLFVLGGIYVLINPVLHGLLLLLLLLGGWQHLRNYVSGRVVQFDNSIQRGNQLKTSDQLGLIERTGRLGIKLRTRQGLHFIDYTRLLREGYTLVAGDEVGGLYQLRLTPPSTDGKAMDPVHALRDVLVTTPYLELEHNPQISLTSRDPLQLNAVISVREERYLSALLHMLEARGYDAQLIQQ